MRIFTLILAVMAVAYSAGRFLSEHKRLGQIQQMGGRDAKAFYEQHRRQYDRTLLIVTIVACVAAAGAFTYAALTEGVAR